MVKRLNIIIKIILSLYTAFIIVKLFHPEIELLPWREWSFETLFGGYNFWRLTIGASFFSLAIFYWVLPLVIMKVFVKKLIAKYSTLLQDEPVKRLTLSKIKQAMRLVIRFYERLFWTESRIEAKKTNNTKLEFYEMIELFVATFCMSIHLFICYLYFAKFSFLIFVVFSAWLILLFFLIIDIPAIYGFINEMNIIFDNELNRDKQQVPDGT